MSAAADDDRHAAIKQTSEAADKKHVYGWGEALGLRRVELYSRTTLQPRRREQSRRTRRFA